MERHEEELVSAVNNNNAEKVKDLFRQHPNLNPNHRNVLHTATKAGYQDVVAALLLQPALDVQQRSQQGIPALYCACERGLTEVAKVLLKDTRVDVNYADGEICTPLWGASYEGHLTVIKWIIASGRELNLERKGKLLAVLFDDNEYSALEIARARGNSEVVLLLERFKRNKTLTRTEIRKELGVAGEQNFYFFFFLENFFIFFFIFFILKILFQFSF